MATQATNPLPSQDEHLFEILKRQEELTAYLVHQAQPHTLPNREIPVFDGNPLHYVPLFERLSMVLRKGLAIKGTACIFWNNLP